MYIKVYNLVYSLETKPCGAVVATCQAGSTYLSVGNDMQHILRTINLTIVLLPAGCIGTLIAIERFHDHVIPHTGLQPCISSHGTLCCSEVFQHSG